MGPDVINLLKNLKKIQIDELNNYYQQEIMTNQVQPTKTYLNAQIGQGLFENNFHPKTETSAKENILPKAATEKLTHVLEQAPAVNIFAKNNFGDSWCDKVLASTKWAERKQMLDSFLKAADTPKINGDSCGPIVQLAKKLVPDSNIQVQICALKIFGALAKGMRKDFGFHIKQHISIILAQLKNRKVTVSEQALQTLSEGFHSFNPEEVIEDIKDA
jgi:hypothetical protein